MAGAAQHGPDLVYRQDESTGLLSRGATELHSKMLLRGISFKKEANNLWKEGVEGSPCEP